MKPFAALSKGAQFRRLRRLAEAALADYDLGDYRLSPIVHLENTTFRVDTPAESYALRISRPGLRTRAEIASEMMWLADLRRETDLIVPRPVANRSGDPVSPAAARGVPESRDCVLFTWVPGRRYRHSPRPVHLRRVGRFTARLHEFAVAYEPPTDFTRPDVVWGTPTSPGVIPEHIAHGMEAGRDVIGAADQATFERATQYLGEEIGKSRRTRETYGLIHADLHIANCLFQGNAVHAIDFDDCGWGHYLYDLGVTLYYVRRRADFHRLRDALFAGYREVRPLEREGEALVDIFLAARILMMATYLAGRRDNPYLWQHAPRLIAGHAEELRAFLQQQGRPAM